MAYNYSRWFLEAYRDVAATIVELGKTDGQAYRDFDDHDGARRYRLFLSNIRACALRNEPVQCRPASKVRTWIAWENERYRVYVGVPRPDQRVRGAKPQDAMPTKLEAFTEGENRLIVPEKLTKENFDAIFYGKVKIAAGVRAELEYVIFEVPPPTQIMAFIAQELDQFGFVTSENTPRFVLHRIKPAPTLPWAGNTPSEPAEPQMKLPEWMKPKPRDS